MSDTKRRKKTPRRQYKGEDQVDTTTKAHVPKNKKPSRKTDKQKHIKEELSNYDDN